MKLEDTYAGDLLRLNGYSTDDYLEIVSISYENKTGHLRRWLEPTKYTDYPNETLSNYTVKVLEDYWEESTFE